MSFDFNYKFWVATKHDIDDIIKRQDVLKTLKPIKNKWVTHTILAELYADYVDLVNRLGYLYHNAFQVQKRDVLRNLTEAATRRLLELKNELKNLELSEFIYVDKTLIKRKLTPDDIVIWRPKYYPLLRTQPLEDLVRDGYSPDITEIVPEISSQLLSAEPKIGVDGPEVPYSHISRPARVNSLRAVEEKNKYLSNLGKSVKILQAHERARKNRVRFTNIRNNPQLYLADPFNTLEMHKYKFTHKENQIMRVPVKKTVFLLNYMRPHIDMSGFKYYVKPEDNARSSSETKMLSSSTSLNNESINDINQNQFLETDTENIIEAQVQENAAINIQAAWRGYKCRVFYAKKLLWKSQLYGMVFKPKFTPNSHNEYIAEARQHEAQKRQLDEDFIKLCTDERTRILKVKSPWIMEDISDHIRDWFREFYDKIEYFHPFPDAIKSGTILILIGETLDVVELHDKLNAKKLSKEEKKKEAEKRKILKKKQQDKVRKEKLKAEKKKRKLKMAGIFDIADHIITNKNISRIEETIGEYYEQWRFIDEHLNKDDSAIKDWVTAEQLAQIHKELRTIVDEFMRIEYELLERALAKDQKRRYKQSKKKNRKRTKPKRSKKKRYDPTSERTVESLYFELQQAEIIKSAYNKKSFSDFVGDRNYLAYDLQQISLANSVPRKGEITDIMRECILGMGPLNVNKPKSLCLVGPKSSGKKLLCDIFASEINALIIDLSPEVTYKYEGNLNYLAHIIIKVAKLLQPTIILIQDVHRLFWKNIPPDQSYLNPKLLATILKRKILKSIKMADKVILLGTSEAPWTANKKLKKCFQKFLLVSANDYGTNFLLWLYFIFQHSAVSKNFQLSPLALATKNYASGSIVDNINETLNLRRRMSLSRKPLNPMEFIETFLERGDLKSQFPLEEKEWQKFCKWFSKTNKLAKARTRYIKKLELSNKTKNKNNLKTK